MIAFACSINYRTVSLKFDPEGKSRPVIQRRMLKSAAAAITPAPECTSLRHD